MPELFGPQPMNPGEYALSLLNGNGASGLAVSVVRGKIESLSGGEPLASPSEGIKD